MQRVSFFSVLLLLLSACIPEMPKSIAPVGIVQSSKTTLPDLGIAPELTNDVWLNVSEPLRLSDLRGKVVLLNMWTFDCINCKNVIPSLRRWHAQYSKTGLVVIGNHFPEFEREADLENLQQAVTKLDIQYAVSQDNQGVTWRAYKNNYWPTIYLIDKRGHLRYMHIGEGSYDKTEMAIQSLLAEPEL